VAATAIARKVAAGRLQEVPTSIEVATSAYGLPEPFQQEPDRLIGATARLLDASVVTVDRRAFGHARLGRLGSMVCRGRADHANRRTRSEGGMGMIDHIGLSVADYERSKAFYLEALAPLGYELVMEIPEGGPHAGLGAGGKPDFWITKGQATTPQVHIAFGARDRATVRAFYDAALAAGARDNGPPGLRPQYHPDYYGAFVLDPDGHNVEAVCHDPE
jgi:catechol 2,3-dioxygenase-like lactoylglutathione lyase family enzyme